MHTSTPEHHDVVVVGSRCAGAATAMLLARQGIDVVAVDRSRFPSDTLSTHAIARGGVVQLSRWGLLDEVVASGAPPIREVSFHIGDDVVRKQIKRSAGVDHLVAPRRDVLDDILFRAAGAAGADMRTGITVGDVSRGPSDRITGVVGRDEHGKTVDIRARFVIGADGLRSRIARAVGAPIIDRRHANGAVFYTYVDGLDFAGTEFHLGDRAFGGLFPTHHGEANVWISTPAADVAHLRGNRDRSGAFHALLHAAVPSYAARVAKGRQTAPVRGFAGMPNQLRQPAGDGWALVGDAGYFRDAVTGHGMTDAFRDAELLARSIGDVFAGRAAEQEAMRSYGAQRDQMVAELFDLACGLSLYPPAPEFAAMQKQLSRRIEIEAETLAALPPMDTRHAQAA